MVIVGLYFFSAQRNTIQFTIILKQIIITLEIQKWLRQLTEN